MSEYPIIVILIYTDLLVQKSKVDPLPTGLIYENLEKMKKFEPKYRLKRVGAPGCQRL